MSADERLDRIEHVTAAIAEERRKDREEYKALWRDTQRQIDDNARGDVNKDYYGRRPEPDGLYKNRTGAIYKIKPLGTAVGQQNYTNAQRLAPGVWHRLDIKVVERTYEVLLNGQPATKFTADSADPNEKFRGRKKGEDPDSGFIGLQTHTGNVAFANIRIKK